MQASLPLSAVEAPAYFPARTAKTVIDIRHYMWYIFIIKSEIHHKPQEECFMKRKVNYLGFLSLLALISILGLRTENAGLFGFFGFVYYLRYFWVVPDEFFLLNVQKAATFAFMAEMLSLVPCMFVCFYAYGAVRAVPAAFGLSFAIAILAFTAALAVLEWRARKGAVND